MSKGGLDSERQQKDKFYFENSLKKNGKNSQRLIQKNGLEAAYKI